MRSEPEGKSVDVVALSTFPLGAAATRFRIVQFLPHLASGGLRVTFFPFLTDATFRDLYDPKKAVVTSFRVCVSLLRRILQLPRILRADVLLVQREVMLFGPPWIEWLASRVARVPIVLDLDDATWIAVTSPVYGRLATLLKWPSKTDQLIRWADTVICGNQVIADHVQSLGARAVIMPTIVDTASVTPRTDAPHDVPVVGWVGTHSTWRYVEPLLPLLETLAQSVPFRLKVVGSGRPSLAVRGVDVELLPWRLDREVHDFQTIDVGIYPLPDDSWSRGKSGLKIIQYFAAGVACVASPVGIVREIGIAGVTHLQATTPEEWRSALERLLRDSGERRLMADAGRRYAVEHYSVAGFAKGISAVLLEAAGRRRTVTA